MGRPIKKGSTDQSTTIKIIDATTGLPEEEVVWNTAGIDLWYRREGEVVVDITEATLATLDAAHSDGGFLHIKHGCYRLDLPDAAVAAGAGKNSVHIGGTVTGMIVIGNDHALVDYDPYDSADLGLTILSDWADGGRLDLLLDAIPTTAMRGTDNAALASVVGALADAAAGGEVTEADTLMQYIKQLINILIGTPGIAAFPSEAAPANAVSLAEVIRAIHADVTGLNGDAMRGTNGANTTVPDAAGIAATPAEVATALETYDGPTRAEATADKNEILTDIAVKSDTLKITGIASVTDQTHFVLDSGSDDDDAYNGMGIVLYDGSSLSYPSVRKIVDYTGGTLTVEIDSAPDFTLTDADCVRIFAAVPGSTAPTPSEIQAEMEEEGASLLDEIRDDLANATDGLGALKALIDAVQADLDNGTDGLGALKTLIDAVKTVADAVQAKTDNLPADPADDSDIDGQLAAIAGYLDTEIAAIKTVTDALPEGGALTTLLANLAAIKVKTDNQPAGIPKNVAWPNFRFLMVDSTDHLTPKAGLTVSGSIQKDAGSFAALTNSVVEIANGWYRVDLTQAEKNADDIALRFTATGADTRNIAFKTST